MPSRPRIVATLALLLALLLPTLTFPIPARAAGIVVTSLADTSGDPAVCTLRDAMIAANADSNAAAPGCTAGSGADAITFQAGLTGTILLGDDLPTVTTAMAITGPGAADIAIDRNSAVGGASAFLIIAGAT